MLKHLVLFQLFSWQPAPHGQSQSNVAKQASNQIPTFATAVLDLRLVLGYDWQRQQQKVINHIKAQGYFVIDRESTDEERLTHSKIIRVISGTDTMPSAPRLIFLLLKK